MVIFKYSKMSRVKIFTNTPISHCLYSDQIANDCSHFLSKIAYSCSYNLRCFDYHDENLIYHLIFFS